MTILVDLFVLFYTAWSVGLVGQAVLFLDYLSVPSGK